MSLTTVHQHDCSHLIQKAGNDIHRHSKSHCITIQSSTPSSPLPIQGSGTESIRQPKQSCQTNKHRGRCTAGNYNHRTANSNSHTFSIKPHKPRQGSKATTCWRTNVRPSLTNITDWATDCSTWWCHSLSTETQRHRAKGQLTNNKGKMVNQTTRPTPTVVSFGRAF
jgi:hypothetical protein